MDMVKEYNEGLRKAAYVTMKLAVIGGIVWLLNVVFFFIEYFSQGVRLPNFRELIAGYGGALIAAIVPIMLLYMVGGIANILLDIEKNTRK